MTGLQTAFGANGSGRMAALPTRMLQQKTPSGMSLVMHSNISFSLCCNSFHQIAFRVFWHSEMVSEMSASAIYLIKMYYCEQVTPYHNKRKK